MDKLPYVKITFPQPALPLVEIEGLTPFQLMFAATLLARVADKSMSQMEETMSRQQPTALVVAKELPKQ